MATYSISVCERRSRARRRPPPDSFPLTRQLERAIRQAVFRQGELILTDGEKIPVEVKNISATGANVEFFVRRELPERVILVELTLRIQTHARVAWQRDGVAGLAFTAGDPFKS